MLLFHQKIGAEGKERENSKLWLSLGQASKVARLRVV